MGEKLPNTNGADDPIRYFTP